MWIAKFKFKDWTTGNYFVVTKKFSDNMDLHRYKCMTYDEAEFLGAVYEGKKEKTIFDCDIASDDQEPACNVEFIVEDEDLMI